MVWADRQMIEKRLGIRGTQVPWVLFVMEENVLDDPVAISHFRAGVEMSTSADGYLPLSRKFS